MQHFAVIPVFVTVVEAGGFSPAAAILGISKSAVSKRITQLEEQLGVKLLHRTTRKLSLTEAGEHFYAHARIAHQAGVDAQDSVTQLQGEPQGRLRINAPMSFGRLHLAPLVPVFLKRYPKLSVDLVMEDKVSDLIGEGFDIAIRAGDLPDSSLIARKLAPLKSVLCAAPDYLSKHGIPNDPEALKRHNCMLFAYSNDAKEWVFIKNQQRTSVEVRGNYQVNNSEALREAIVQGIGIGRLPSFVAGPDLKSGQLVQLFPEYMMPQKTIYAVFPERQYMPAKVRAFIEFAVEYFGGDIPYWDQ